MNQNVSIAHEYETDPPPFGHQLRDYFDHVRNDDNAHRRHVIIAVIMGIALLAFEIFNFDTTRFALSSLIGDPTFVGVGWATILAIAFCSIDFAGLIRLFTPDNGEEQPREVWYLMGAWILGATMNAVMTWWAVSLTLLSHDFGNEILSRETLLTAVPIFVAVLVWLTRILFIGALTVTGEQLLEYRRSQTGFEVPQRRVSRPQRRQQPVEPVQARLKERGPNEQSAYRRRQMQQQQVVEVVPQQPVQRVAQQPARRAPEPLIEQPIVVKRPNATKPKPRVQPKPRVVERKGVRKPQPSAKPKVNRPATPAPKSGGLRPRTRGLEVKN